MTDVVKLHFMITVEVPGECADDLGVELAEFFQESWLNGDDILEVKYVGYDIIL